MRQPRLRRDLTQAAPISAEISPSINTRATSATASLTKSSSLSPRALTGLSPDLLDVIGGHQITEPPSSGCRSRNEHDPCSARWPAQSTASLRPENPIRPGLPSTRTGWSPRSPTATRLALLARLLGGRREGIAANRIPKTVRTELNALRDNAVIELERGVCRISDIALFSSYQLPAPPIRTLTNKREDRLTSSGNLVDI
jgi:hypothetical protein